MVSLPAAATAMSAASVPFTFGDEQARTAPRIVAQQTAEMFCYLWYSSSLATAAATRAKRSHMHPPRSPQDSTRLALQLSPAPAFVDFVLRLLETTQVSQSVIVLGLHYVYRLKESAVLSFGQAGSENRVAVVALMLANKFVDDNTYTNKTWADVSNIDLREINRMEREFLQSIEYRLAVDAATYHSWLNLLRGLVQAKDRELRLWTVQQLKLQRKTPDHRRSDTPRARSSSPTLRDPAAYPFTFVVPTSTAAQYPHQGYSYYAPPSTAPGPSSSPPRKRVRETFSPVNAHPAKRAFVEYREPETHDVDMHQHQHQQSQQPVLHVQTQLAQYPRQQQQLSAGAVERSFARMSLCPQQHQPQNQQQLPSPQEPGYSSQPHHQPLQQQGQALVAPCHPDVNVNVGPQTLYYIKLASSPSEGDVDRERKGRLQYHQPTQQLHAQSQQAAPTVYSAGASYAQAYSTPGPAVNPYPTPVTAAAYAPANRLAMSTNTSPIPVAVSYGQQQYPHSQQQQQRTVVHPHLSNILTPPPSSSGMGPTVSSFVQVPAYQQSQPAHVHPNAQPAPFANAGPAGVRMHWATNAPPVAAAGSGTQSVYAQHARHAQGRVMAGPVGAGGRRILRSQASLPETQGWTQQPQPQPQQQQPSPQPQRTYDQQVTYGGQMQALQAQVQHWQQQQYPSPPAQQPHTSPHVHQQQYYVSPAVQPYGPTAWPQQSTETAWSATHQNQQVHGWATQAQAEWPRVVV